MVTKGHLRVTISQKRSDFLDDSKWCNLKFSPLEHVRTLIIISVFVPILITEWFDNIPFDCRCFVHVSRCVQVSNLLPLVHIWVVSQNLRQVVEAAIQAS